MKKVILSMLAISALMFTSCSEDDDMKSKRTKEEEIISLFKNLNNGEVKNVEALKDHLDKNSIADLTKWATEFEKVKTITTLAEQGKAGQMPRGKKTLYLNEKAVEPLQLVKKGMVGAFQLNGFNTYAHKAYTSKTNDDRQANILTAVTYLVGNLESAKQTANVGDTKDDIKKAAKAFGNEGNSFAKYMMVTRLHKDFFATLKEVQNAKDTKTFKPALTKLTNVANKVIAMRTVAYLGGYAEKLRNKQWTADNIHEVSEGLGFAYALYVARNDKGQPYYTQEEVKKIAETDLWAVKVANEETEVYKFAKKVANDFNINFEEVTKE